MPRSRTAITDPSDIPTLSDLWAQGELQKHPEPEAKPDEEINKRVSIWRGKLISHEHETGLIHRRYHKAKGTSIAQDRTDMIG
jgi:hypothetical protein